MNTDASSLERMHDLIVPGPVPWWPPAPGWYWVIAFTLVALSALLVKGVIRWQQRRYRREALAELKRHEAALKNPEQRAATLLRLSELLKRTAITAFSRQRVAALTGQDWFGFLDRTANNTAFSAGLGVKWQNAYYDLGNAAPLDEPTLRELTAAIRRWIANHRTDTAPKGADA